MCSGRVDPAFILRAFSKGTDGVFIGGCHINDCHYVPEGNYDSFAMVSMYKRLLKHIGINPERLRLEWVSAGEGIRFANIMNEFGNKVKDLGPLGQSEGLTLDEIKSRIEALEKLIPYIKLVERERLRAPVRKEEAYEKFYASDEFNKLFSELIIDKLAVSQITSLLEKNPLPTGEIARILGMTPSEVSRHINNSSKQGLVRFDVNSKCYALA